jgi:hypothetical protein
LIDLAETVHDRCDDSNGVLDQVFTVACRNLGHLAQATHPDTIALADRAFTARNHNHYGQYDLLIEAIGPSLGASNSKSISLLDLKPRFAFRFPEAALI